MSLLDRVIKITKLSMENRELKEKINELRDKIVDLTEIKEDKLYRVSYSGYVFFSCVGSEINASFVTKDISQETLDIHIQKIKERYDNKLCMKGITNIEEISKEEVIK